MLDILGKKILVKYPSKSMENETEVERMLFRNSYCTEPCCDMGLLKTEEKAEMPGCKTRIRRSIYMPSWAAAVVFVLVVALLTAGLFALLAAQAVWNADIEMLDVTVRSAEEAVCTLPGLSFNGALFVEARAYHNAFPAEHIDAQTVSCKYRGNQTYYELNEAGGLIES